MTLIIFRGIYILIICTLAFLIWNNRERLGCFLTYGLIALLTGLNWLMYANAFYFENLFLSRWSVSVNNVTSGNEFEIYSFVKNDRSVFLRGTRLPKGNQEKENSRLELEKLLHKQKVTIEFLPNIDYSSEPWPVYAFINGEEINQLLIDKGTLLPSDDGLILKETIDEQEITDDKIIPEKIFRIWIKIPPVGRYIIWIFLGFLGSNALSRFIIFRKVSDNLEKATEAFVNLFMFLVIILSAVYSIANSYYNQISIYPPIICLVLNFLMLGRFMEKTREQNGVL